MFLNSLIVTHTHTHTHTHFTGSPLKTRTVQPGGREAVWLTILACKINRPLWEEGTVTQPLWQRASPCVELQHRAVYSSSQGKWLAYFFEDIEKCSFSIKNVRHFKIPASLNVRICSFSFSFTTVNEESLGFRLSVGQKMQIWRQHFGLWWMVTSKFFTFKKKKVLKAKRSID